MFTCLPAAAAELRAPLEHELRAEGFAPLKNETLLRAARRLPVSHVPVWAMRQAGRYLPEYLEAGKDLDFFTRCRTPELACQVTLQPLVRFPLDAAIIFSDILVVLQALGMHCEMKPGVGPVFPEPISKPEDLARITPADRVDVNVELGYVFKALTLTRHRLQGHVPLIGFAGAPWTLMSYAVEGHGSKTWDKAKSWLYTHPEASHRLLTTITEVTIKYLVGQVRAGAQILQVFDSWAGALSPDLFRRFALPYLSRIATEVKAQLGAAAVPMIVFAKGAHWAIAELESTDYDVLGLDWTHDVASVKAIVKGRQALQGNLDPAVLYAPDEVIRQEVAKMMSNFSGVGHIANLGHGMNPDMQPRALAAFVDAVHQFSADDAAAVRIGTRASILAMVQTYHVVDRMTQHFPNVRFAIHPIRSAGDLNLKLDLDKFDRPGVFTDALEEALLAGTVDLLVHSLKDMPSQLRAGTQLAAISAREDPADAVVFHARHKAVSHLRHLPAGAVVGTSSARRRAQLAAAYPHLQFKAVRGNVMTRLRKLDDYDACGYDALCLASAGLTRLGMQGRIQHLLDCKTECLHAIGQGALGLQVRSSEGSAAAQARGKPSDERIAHMCRVAIHDEPVGRACLAERAFLKAVGGGCSLPIGIYSHLDADSQHLELRGIISSMDGQRRVEATVTQQCANDDEARAAGNQLCQELLTEEGQKLLAELRERRDAQKGGDDE